MVERLRHRAHDAEAAAVETPRRRSMLRPPTGPASSWRATCVGRARSNCWVLADEFARLHGDQVFGDDEAVVAGSLRSAATGWRSSV